MKNKYKDRVVSCPCGNTFIWTAGEQEYYRSRGYHAPKLCRPCREERKKKFRESGGGKFQ